MTSTPLIDDMDRFFAHEWQNLADDIQREPARTPQMEDERRRALAKAAEYRERILAEAGR